MEDSNKIGKIYLVGFMGAGKTTFGKVLASRMNYKFYDLDKEFEKKYKITVDLFFKKYGEKLFRELEYNLLLSTGNLENAVISTGGGTPCFYNSMDWIKKNGTSIYLNLPPKVLFDRLSNAKKKRPLVAEKNDGELLVYIEEKLKEREPFYRKADLIISGISLSVDSVISIINRLNQINKP